MSTTRVKWIEEKTFLGTASNGHQVVMASGDAGVSPMQMLLLGLGGCTAIDVVDIMRKQRNLPEALEVEVSGERGTELPKPWKAIHIHFIFTGVNVDPAKVQRAIDLSVEKYCGAHATLSGVAEITHDFEIRVPEIALDGNPD